MVIATRQLSADSENRLETYRRKRAFGRTPEPKGSAKKKKASRSERPVFVVQKHQASQLHYDFRLEIDGALKSWAVPKGPSIDPGVKSLAVEVEDHPLEYASFEGVIPSGQYGAGAVMIWDRGEWTPSGDPRKDLERGRLSFTLHGDKLRGGWTLVRMTGKTGKASRNWLLVKKRDEDARPGDGHAILDDEDRSVESGRSLEEISNSAPHRRSKARAKPATRRNEPALNGEDGRSRSEPRPAFITPQLATLVKDVPEGDDWLHEIKFDGYRLLCVVTGHEALFFTRRGNNWTAKFPGLARAASRLAVKDAILDGEVVALRPDGVSDFQTLQNAFTGESRPRLVYYAFDLLYADGEDMRGKLLVDRKRRLERILDNSPDASPMIAYSDHRVGHGARVYADACRLGLEGIISKRADSPYVSTRSESWLKVKCVQRQEFVIGGYTDPAGARTQFGALLLGYYDDGRLTYCGKVGTGFTSRSLKRVLKLLRPLEQSAPAFANPPKGYEARGVHWVEPSLVGEVEFTGFTGDSMLRHPSFQGLREDKPAREVVREEPRPASRSEARDGRPAGAPARTGPSETEVAGVRISNADRVVYPAMGVTKGDVAAWFERMAKHILPHVADRPMAVVRCPRGMKGVCFFQRHVARGMPEAIRTVTVTEKNGESAPCIVIDDAAGLVSLVQFGALELHPWACRADNVEKPDRLIFDLDPGKGVEWSALVQAAQLVRESLAAFDLESFVKTSGGKGLHVVAPIARRADWDVVSGFARAVAERIAADDPDRYTASMSKSRRTGRVFIDYLRNQRGATSIAPYSVRARQGATVSSPLDWSELDSGVHPDMFTILNVQERVVSRKRDPWRGFFELKQPLTPRMAAAAAGAP